MQTDDSPLPEVKAGEQEGQEQPQPFRLRGSIQSHLSADELGQWIDDNRKHQAALFEEKMRRWFEEE